MNVNNEDNLIYSNEEQTQLEDIMKLPERNNTDFPISVYNVLKSVKLSEDDVLQYHQKLVQYYFTTYTNHRGLLIFHATGTGKTMLSVAVADALKDIYDVIVLSAKSLQNNMKKEIKKYMKLLKIDKDDINDAIYNKYNFISSNAGNMLEQLSRVGKTTQQVEFEKSINVQSRDLNLNGKLLVIDEAQNFFNGIVNGSKNAVGLYKAIMEAKNIKLVFLSATPIVNDPFEMVPMFNMLHGYTLLPENYDDFNKHYIDHEKLIIKNKEKLKNRIFGLVSYMGDWWKTGGIVKPGQIIKRQDFPDQLPTIIEYVPMSSHQFTAYQHARDLETKVTQKRVTTTETLQKPKTDPSSTYRVASRQISNFALPDTIKVKKLTGYGFDKHIDKLTIEHLTELSKYSPKMEKMFNNILKHKGTAVVYSSFVAGEGLKIFSKVLEVKGWQVYTKKKSLQDTQNILSKFAFITGDIEADERSEIIKAFNNKNNIDGSIIKILMISSAGAEGLDLKNVMSVHIMEPYWNYGRIEQIIARAVRYKSHEDYPNPLDRKVQPYIYLSDYPTGYVFKPTPSQIKRGKKQEKTTDVYLYNGSIKGKILIDRFYAVMIEASIDCSIHIEKSPLEVKNKIQCVMCTPDNVNMFHQDPYLDLKLKNPCKKYTKKEVTAHQLEYGNDKYFYTIDPNTKIIKIYRQSKDLDAFIEVDRTNQDYETLIEIITKSN
jgi:superfamily II DNA or RNA helicase